MSRDTESLRGMKMAEGKLGSRIRRYREQLGLSQEQLAVNAGLDVNLLDDVEAGRTYPAIGNIIKLSRALGQRVGTFIDDQFRPDPIINKAGTYVEETESNRGANGHYHYFPLGAGKTDRHMEPMFIRIDEDHVRDTSSHEGEEFIIVVSGKVLFRYGKSEEILTAGDTVYYNSVVPHYIGAIDGPAEIYAILYTPI